MTAHVHAVLLAAGRSSRTGSSHKLLATFEGIPLIRRSAQAAVASRAAGVTVVIGHRAAEMREALADLPVEIVENPRFAEGLSTSLIAGFDAAPSAAEGVLVMLADQPLLTAADLDTLVAAFSPNGSIVVATDGGKRFNPVVIDRRYADEVGELTGDVGAKRLILLHSDAVVEVEVGRAASCDVDSLDAIIETGGLPERRVSASRSNRPRTLRFVLGDQLSRNLSSLADIAKDDVVLMAEVSEEATYVRHHKRKIAFLFSAMRHFAADLRDEGVEVDYVELDAPGNGGSFTEELKRAVGRHEPDRIVVTEPGEWRVLEMMKGWTKATGLPVEIRPDDRFLASHRDFEAYARRAKGLRLETFYREMRAKTGYLMIGDGEPVDGRWNFDEDNRKPLPRNAEVPRRPAFPPDEATEAVLALVERRFGNHFGRLDGFGYPVTRKDALRYLDWFASTALADFGAYQDAMRQGSPLLFHSHLSALINCGLLSPNECCEKAEAAYRSGDAPINAVEGFIRQIIGWREFIRGVYWLRMPGYGDENALNAKRRLPDFFWTGDTDLNCLAQSIGETRDNAYAHHIQRLMVIGNFCLIAGLDPREVQEWYLVVYHDAYEWVEMPNVVGIILHADGGLIASKPYAASGNYIDRMSDYCGTCRYSPKVKLGPDACPFNYLYWDFLDRNRRTLGGNRRLDRPYATLDRMDNDRVAEIRRQAKSFLDALPSSGQY